MSGEREGAGVRAGGLVGNLLEDGSDASEDGEVGGLVGNEGLDVEVCRKDELVTAAAEAGDGVAMLSMRRGGTGS